MGRSDYWKAGDPNAICDVCGFKYKLSQLRKRWDGLMCCPEDWNIRQPQDFVRGVRDDRPIPQARPEPPDVFIGWNYTVTLIDSTLTSDGVSFSYRKYVPILLSEGTLNDWSLNGLVLNGSQYEYAGNSETTVTTESVRFNDRNFSPVDASATGENVTLAFVPRSFSTLNSAVLDSFTLG